jgi:rhamnogalacturonan endolyase
MNPGDYSTLYWYMHSGHVQTEAFRPGLKGPYALVFSRSGKPSGNEDFSFMSGLGLTGYVAESARGRGMSFSAFFLQALFLHKKMISNCLQ